MLKSDQYACSTYEQANKKCDNCLRNIGFFSGSHKKWKSYYKKGDECDGYIDRAKIKK